MTFKVRQKASKRQEKRTAAEVGGRTQPGSGSQWHSKGDVRADDLLVECKTTTKLSYVLKVETLLKVQMEGYKQGGRTSVLQVEFANRGKRYAVIPWEEYLAMRER